MTDQLCLGWSRYSYENGGFLAYLAHPLRRSAKWKAGQNELISRDAGLESSADCVAPASCLIATFRGNLLSTSRADSTQPWDLLGLNPVDSDRQMGLTAVQCTNATRCLAFAQSAVFASADPFAGETSSWGREELPVAPGQSVWDASCPTEQVCYAFSAKARDRRRSWLIVGRGNQDASQ